MGSCAESGRLACDNLVTRPEKPIGCPHCLPHNRDGTVPVQGRLGPRPVLSMVGRQRLPWSARLHLLSPYSHTQPVPVGRLRGEYELLRDEVG